MAGLWTVAAVVLVAVLWLAGSASAGLGATGVSNPAADLFWLLSSLVGGFIMHEDELRQATARTRSGIARRRALRCLVCVLVGASVMLAVLAVAGGLEIFEDGSWRIGGCLPGALCNR